MFKKIFKCVLDLCSMYKYIHITPLVKQIIEYIKSIACKIFKVAVVNRDECRSSSH